ncbi:MAG: hypothetical protein P4M15_05370 [Alphaproteobacteria bacterium]|nr:hypothetical protein [Alphaproteobacteria bacterium]
MTKRALGISYITENQALYCAAMDYCGLLRQAGYEADVHDAAAPGGLESLFRRLETEQYDFCYGMQGVGSMLSVGGQNLWELKRIPFIGIHYDNPCHNIFNHANTSRYVANIYCFASHLDIHRRYIGTQQIIAHAPFEAMPFLDPAAAFPKRSIRLLYIKSGGDLEECKQVFGGLPDALQKILWEKITVAEQNPNLVICDLIQEIFDTFRAERKADFDLFWGLARWVDVYIRRKRAITFVNWLKYQEGATIVGNGWDSIDKTGARASFRPSVPGPAIEALYRDTQIVCNTNPHGGDIIHERAASGLLHRCAVISDANQWWQERAGEFPFLTLFDWNKSLDEQLQPALQRRPTAEDLTVGQKAANRHFAAQRRCGKLLETVEAVRHFAETPAHALNAEKA